MKQRKKPPTPEEVAKRIATVLFTNGISGKRVDTLTLVDDANPAASVGWCQSSVETRIAQAIRADRATVAKFRRRKAARVKP